jgi:mannose-6-phosphate isomerase
VNSNKPRRLPTSFKQKVWGSTNLSPLYPPPDEKTGEVWFEADLPLLVKFIFTTDRLSVQVHPDDAFAAEHENSRGKTEMWHVLRAEPGAQVALGFREAITPERLKETALSGEILQLLNWVDAHAGDTFFTPAGTIHAIGAGLTMCEIQQNSDVTYRIYDYGRPRPMHLDKAMQVCCMGALDAKPVALPLECKYFRTEALCFDKSTIYQPHAGRFELLIFCEGVGMIGDKRYRLGETWLIPAGTQRLDINPHSATKLLRTWVPSPNA